MLRLKWVRSYCHGLVFLALIPKRNKQNLTRPIGFKKGEKGCKAETKTISIQQIVIFQIETVKRAP